MTKAAVLLAVICIGCGSSNGSGGAGGAGGSAGAGGAAGGTGLGGGAGTGHGGSGGSAGGAGGAGGGPSDAGAQGTDGPACNNLGFGDAQLIPATVVQNSSPPVAAAGGSILQGTYVLTSVTFYEGADAGADCQPSTTRATAAKYLVSLSAANTGTVEELFGGNNGGDGGIIEAFRANFSFTATGSSVTTQVQCDSGQGVVQAGDGGGAVSVGSYTATSTQFTLYSPQYADATAMTGFCGTMVSVLTME